MIDRSALEKSARDGATFLPVAWEYAWDRWTTVEAYERLKAKTPRSFLLESAAGGEAIGRYSFMGIEPFAVLRLDGHHLSYESKDESWSGDVEKPMAALGERLQRYQAPFHKALPPFQGGAVGYVSYDAVRFLERVPELVDGPPSADAHFMFFNTVLAVDRLKHRLYVMSGIFPERESIADGLKRVERERDATLARLDQASPKDPLFPFEGEFPEIAVTPHLGEARFADGVKLFKQHIRKGDIFQGVLSDSFSFDLKADPFLVYRALRMINPSPYLFHVDCGDETLLGASPEMLVKVLDRRLSTCPIAGTRPRGKDEREDLELEKNLLASVKERAEHLMLVDLGRNDIGRVAELGSVVVKDFMHVERFSHVMHLVSLVEGKLRKGLSAWDAFCAAFPAGTLSGAPKIKAMELIAAAEGRRRGPYGGAVVYHDFSGNLNSCITIRSLYTKGGRASIQAGAGVVADSTAQREYEEVHNKARAMRRALGCAYAMAGAR